jgi:hypothetical protein
VINPGIHGAKEIDLKNNKYAIIPDDLSKAAIYATDLHWRLARSADGYHDVGPGE